MLTASLGEGAGGGAAAVRTWADTLVSLGATVALGCLDLSSRFGKNLSADSDAFQLHEFPGYVVPVTRLIIAPKLPRLLERLICELKPDVIHANGIWSPITRTAARIAKRRGIAFVVSPHGHIQPWAMANGSLKKRAAWSVYGRRSVQAAAIVQAATEAELSALKANGITRPISVIPNIVPMPDGLESVCPDQQKIVLFMSRIHPSKGVGDLVEAWSRVKTDGWRLVIAGPDEVGYARHLVRRIAELDLSNAEYVGAVAYEERWKWYRRATLSILPTYSENFGIAIGEALAVGVPVITTTSAPWEVIREARFGWWVSPGIASLRRALSEALATPSDDLARMGESGRSFVERNYAATAIASRLLSLYQDAILSLNVPNSGERP